MPRMKTKLITENLHQYEVAYQDVTALVSKHAGKMSALELLAVASNMLGKLIALQDQRKYSAEEVMQIVNENILAGNKQVIDGLRDATPAGRG